MVTTATPRFEHAMSSGPSQAGHSEKQGMTQAPRPEHQEGPVARAIEQQTAKLPSDLFLWAAGGSILASLALKMTGRANDAMFVGQWAPTFLILGLYNKLVKVAGSDPGESKQTG
jgi:hypothetical protein